MGIQISRMIAVLAVVCAVMATAAAQGVAATFPCATKPYSLEDHRRIVERAFDGERLNPLDLYAHQLALSCPGGGPQTAEKMRAQWQRAREAWKAEQS